MTYTPDADYAGADSLEFAADDGSVNSGPATVTITVAEVNDLPRPSSDVLATGPETPLTINRQNLALNDVPGPPDEADQKLTVTAVKSGVDTHGTLGQGPNGFITFTPEPGFSGTAAFTYTVCDDGTSSSRPAPACATGHVTVYVTSGAPPTALTTVVSTPRKTPVHVHLGAIDPGGAKLTFAIISSPAHGYLTGAAPDLVYNPTTDYVGDDAFTFAATNPTGMIGRGSITIHVKNTPPPSLRDDEARVAPGATATIDVLSNDAAAVGTLDPATLQIATAPSKGRAISSGGVILFTAGPAPGSDSLTYNVCDRAGVCGQAVVTLVLKGPNHPPRGAADAYAAETGAPLVIAAPGVLENDADPDVGDRPHVRLLVGVRAGTLLLQSTGAFTYTASAGFTGSDSFSYYMLDESGSSSAPVVVSISVTAHGLLSEDDTLTTQRDIPIGVPAPGLLENDHSVVSGSLSARVSQSPFHGDLELRLNGSFDYQPDPGFIGIDQFAYVMTDSMGTNAPPAYVTITVAPPSSAPGTARILTPADGSRIGATAPVTSEVDLPAGDSVAKWSLTVRPDHGDPVLLNSGWGTPPSRLGVFDATVHRNGLYRLHLVVRSSRGADASADSTVVVLGSAKLGHYATTITDMTAQLAGLPVTVERTYDTTDGRKNDFGIGWQLSLNGYSITPNGRLGVGGWFTEAHGFPFTQLEFRTSRPHTVTVVSPTGMTEVFDLQPLSTSPLLSLTTPAFKRRVGTGTTSILEDADPPTLSATAGTLRGFLTGEEYNPRLFRLTLRTGTVLLIDRFDGVRSVTDRSGNSIQIDSDGIHASNGGVIEFERDSLDRITKIARADGHSVSYRYGETNELVRVVALNGELEEYHYDQHRLTSISGPNGERLRTIVYDDAGRVARLTDGTGRTTRVRVDVPGRQQAATSPSGRLVVLSTYDNLGRTVLTQQVFGGHATAVLTGYDNEDRVIEVTGPGARHLRYGYDVTGNPVSATLSSGKVIRRSFNAFGQQTSETAPGGIIRQSATYDSGGNLATYSDAGGKTVHTYDARGFPLTESTSLGTTTFVYDSDGRMTKTTDPLGRATQYTYDAAGNVVEEREPSGAVTATTYSGSGQPLRVQTPGGGVWSFTYDDEDRVTSRTDPSGRVSQYHYDVAGRIMSMKDRNDVVTTYEYDVDGSLSGQSFSDGTPVQTIVNDALGRTVELKDGPTTVSRTFDDLNQMHTERVTGAGLPGSVLTYGYDSDGLLAAVTGAAGAIQFARDDAGRVSSVHTAGGKTVGIGYDADRLSQLARPNGVADRLVWNDNGNLVSRRATGPQGAAVATAEYGIDSAGRRTAMTDTYGLHVYGYDADDHLTSATAPPVAGLRNDKFTYDDDDNRTSWTDSPRGVVYDASSQLQADANAAYAYDGEGRLLSSTNRSTGLVTRYRWDSSGRLSEVNGPGLEHSVYTYDAVGRRVATRINGVVTRYVYSGWNVYATYDSTNAVTAVYSAGDFPDSIYEIRKGSHSYYPTYDGLGSITALTNENGKVEGRITYDPYGLPHVHGTADFTYTFTGQQWDASTGLYYMRARYYDPKTGRFLSQDPVFSASPYSYVHGEPTNLVDITGATAASEDTVLYAAKQGNKCYLGITKNFLARQAAHGLRFPFGLTPLATFGTREAALAVEAYLINQFGGPGGPYLTNLVYSFNLARATGLVQGGIAIEAWIFDFLATACLP